MTVRLFLTGKFLPNYVEAVFASRRLPPKAAVSAYGRHSFVEGIRNGGLDFVKAAVSVFRAWRLPAERQLFSFAVVRQMNEKLLYFECHSQYIGFNFSRNISAQFIRQQLYNRKSYSCTTVVSGCVPCIKSFKEAGGIYFSFAIYRIFNRENSPIFSCLL